MANRIFEQNEQLKFREYIETFLDKKEAVDLEFKSAAGGFPGSFWDTYSAFANTQGGMIVLGVKEVEDKLVVDGFSEEQVVKYKKEFWSNVNNKNTVNFNLLKEEDVLEGEYNGKYFLVFYIPRADRTQRPIYRTTSPYNGTFKRNYEGDYKCTVQEVQRMFADADDSVPRDSRILAGFTFDDIDLESVKQYRSLFGISKPGHAWLVLDDLSLFKKLGGYRKDRISGKEGFTLAGLLMFGKTESITDPECAPNYFPDYREIPNDNSIIRWTDRICPDGTWEANLFQFYRKVLPKLIAVLPKPFNLKNNVRIDDSPTHVAIREAFINSLVHSDYSVNCSVVLEQKSDLFIFSNPGNLLISKAQYYLGGDSVCRNKSLQKMFMLIGSAEKAGSGVDKILSGWKEANWQKPYVEERTQPDKVVLTLPMESLLPQNIKKELIEMYGREIESLGYEKLVTLSICYSEEIITNERLQVVLAVHRADITKLLKDLCSNGYLKSDGSGRGTRYHLSKNGRNLDTSEQNLDTSTGNLDTSKGNLGTSEGNLDTSKLKIVVRGHLSREELEAVIVSCCTDYISLEELAKKINRSVHYLKNGIITEMIHKQKIERLYPAIPNHPNQKIKAKE